MADSKCTSVVEIYLANGRGVALIDAEDAERVSVRGWHLHPQGYAARNIWNSATQTQRGTLLHRFVMRAQKGQEVDHVNGNKLDCRKSNLRFVTRSQNMQNRRGAERKSRSGIRGVSRQPHKDGSFTYYARVQVNGRVFCRCGFKTIEEAAQAAEALRREHFTHSQECS